MRLKDLMSLLQRSTEKYIEAEELDIHLRFKTGTDIQVKEHFLLMSVLRNLVNNGIEALKGRPHGRIEVEEEFIDNKVHF